LPPPAPHPAASDCGRCHAPVIDSELHFVDPALHVDGQVEFTSTCGVCHGLPPAPPHPALGDCSLCHAAVIDRPPAGLSEIAPHIDGVVSLSVPAGCNDCHGSESPAPPPDVAGGSDRNRPGVGAHAAHLQLGPRARPVPCAECHRVPTDTLAAGHIDSPLPAEVTFSGVAQAFGAEPSYSGGRCAQSYCHGDSFVGGRPSGGSETRPEWAGNSPPLGCGSCHGLPPPPPHPQPGAPSADAGPAATSVADCADCHRDIDSRLHFLRPELHVDGTVTFFLPDP